MFTIEVITSFLFVLNTCTEIHMPKIFVNYLIVYLFRKCDLSWLELSNKFGKFCYIILYVITINAQMGFQIAFKINTRLNTRQL